jgi:hypothetical protein
MQISNFQKALAVARRYELDALDVEILAVISAQKDRGEESTIMHLPALLEIMAFGTLNTRVKRMVKLGFLTKTVEESDQRRKIIGYGPRTYEFLNELEKG